MPNTSDEPNKQLARWNTILVGWKAVAAGDVRCLVIGDLNLDYMGWNSFEAGAAKMVDRTKVEVETLGFVQLIGKVTRAWPKPEGLTCRPYMDQLARQGDKP